MKDNSIKAAAEEKYDKLEKELESEDDREKKEKYEFLGEFLEEADFEELEKMGFDESKDFEVEVMKEDDDFVIFRTWRSVLDFSES